MSETRKTSKSHFLELRNMIGDKMVINLDNVNCLWVDFDEVKILFNNDPNEHKFKGFSQETLDYINNLHF